ncbi:MAG: M1 family metallopeptidase, partial [Ilumatobacteraceae bacterium]
TTPATDRTTTPGPVTAADGQAGPGTAASPPADPTAATSTRVTNAPDVTGRPAAGNGDAVPDSPDDPDGVGDSLFPGLGNPGIDVQHYDLDLTYDHATTIVDADVSIDIRFTERREEFTLDSDGPSIDAVTIDGHAAQFRVDDAELRVSPGAAIAAGTNATVDVRYHFTGDSSRKSAGLPIGWFNTVGGSYALNEPDGARFWFPSNDHPSDKATYRFTIHVPAGVTGVANGALESHTTTTAGETWVWDQDEPMTTYLIQVLTGDYEIIDGTGPHGLPLTSVVLRSDKARLMPLIDGISDQITELEQFFGPFPLERYGLAISDMPPDVAMETQGRSLFSDQALSGDMRRDGPVLAHELTHQWFGDAVSPQRWSDVWLNESFATYGEWLWSSNNFGLGGPQTVQNRADVALGSRSPGKTADPTLAELFGSDVYDGGAVAVHALRLEIGDGKFFALLQQWVGDNEGASRNTTDFIALASKVAGTDLTDFFHDWVYSGVVPRNFPRMPPAPPVPAETVTSIVTATVTSTVTSTTGG